VRVGVAAFHGEPQLARDVPRSHGLAVSGMPVSCHDVQFSRKSLSSG